MNGRMVGAAAVVVVLGAGSVLGLRACGDDEAADAAPSRPAMRYEVYVDASESAADRLAGPITTTVERLVRRASEAGSAITIHPVSDSSSSAPEITEADFGDPPATKSDGYLLESWLTGERRRVEEEFARWVGSTTPTDETDLLGALVNASGPARSSGGRPVTIVLVSDGLNYTSQWSWDEGPLDGPGCKELARELTLPDLSGATVLFRTGGHDALAPTQSVEVEACWKEIIHLAGGTTPTGWFGRGST